MKVTQVFMKANNNRNMEVVFGVFLGINYALLIGKKKRNNNACAAVFSIRCVVVFLHCSQHERLFFCHVGNE